MSLALCHLSLGHLVNEGREFCWFLSFQNVVQAKIWILISPDRREEHSTTCDVHSSHFCPEWYLKVGQVSVCQALEATTPVIIVPFNKVLVGDLNIFLMHHSIKMPGGGWAVSVFKKFSYNRSSLFQNWGIMLFFPY